MIFKVKYFGMIAEIAGASENEIELSDSTLFGLREHLIGSIPKLNEMSFQIAVNHKISSVELVLKEEDELAILPPFAGG